MSTKYSYFHTKFHSEQKSVLQLHRSNAQKPQTRSFGAFIFSDTKELSVAGRYSNDPLLPNFIQAFCVFFTNYLQLLENRTKK